MPLHLVCMGEYQLYLRHFGSRGPMREAQYLPSLSIEQEASGVRD